MRTRYLAGKSKKLLVKLISIINSNCARINAKRCFYAYNFVISIYNVVANAIAKR